MTAFKNASQMAKGLIDLVRATDRQQILIDFNEQLLAAQSALFGAQAEYEQLLQVKRELEKRVVEMEDWQAGAARYELKELVPGVFVYAVKAGMEQAEPPHYLCPHCFEKKKRSLLTLPGPGWKKYVCHECKYEAIFERAESVRAIHRPSPRRLIL